MQGKIVLITGANQGIGKASAIALGKLGAKLVLLCRNREKAEAAIRDIEKQGARQVELIVGDMSSQADIRRVAREFKAKHDRLDVLLNNAGALVTSRRTTVDGIEETFAINHLGYFLLTKLLLDVLQASAPARIVNVASEAHRGAWMHWDDLQFEKGYSSFQAYGQSKLCNILFTRELARRLDPHKVTANCLHPGVVASGFGQTYGGFMSVVIKLGHLFMISPEKGARTQVYLASSPEVAGVTGKYFDKCKERRPNAEAMNDDSARRLWELSEKLVASSESAGESVSLQS